MLAPSKARATGLDPTVIGLPGTPVATGIFWTLLTALFATQMLAPSKARANGADPSGSGIGLPGTPVATGIFWTVPSMWFATQMLAPSKARAFGSVPTVIVWPVPSAGYQRRMAI